MARHHDLESGVDHFNLTDIFWSSDICRLVKLCFSYCQRPVTMGNAALGSAGAETAMLAIFAERPWKIYIASCRLHCMDGLRRASIKRRF